jgi:hypothetical protein
VSAESVSKTVAPFSHFVAVSFGMNSSMIVRGSPFVDQCLSGRGRPGNRSNPVRPTILTMKLD